MCRQFTLPGSAFDCFVHSRFYTQKRISLVFDLEHFKNLLCTSSNGFAYLCVSRSSRECIACNRSMFYESRIR